MEVFLYLQLLLVAGAVKKANQSKRLISILEGESMMDKYEYNEKRNAAIASCLEQFVSKGLYETTSRDLSKALNLQSAGMYSYFESKDDAIVVCAEQAAHILEEKLFNIAINCFKKEKACLDELKIAAKQASPMMRFFTQVCSTDKYEEQMRPLLKKLRHDHEIYIKKLSDLISCNIEDIRPLVYIGITAISNYMVYQEETYITPILSFIESTISSKKRKSQEFCK